MEIYQVIDLWDKRKGGNMCKEYYGDNGGTLWEYVRD